MPASPTRSPSSCSRGRCAGRVARGLPRDAGRYARLPVRRDHLPVHRGRRDLGREHPRRMGIRHRQLRVVGGHRPRGHFHLGGVAAAAAEVAHLDQPLRRGDDAVRCHDGGAVPDPAPGPPVVLLLDRALPRPHERVAAVAQPARVGRVRDLDLPAGVGAVLVPGHVARPGDDARPRATRAQTGRLRPARARLARGLAPLEHATSRATCCWPASPRRW